MMVVSACPQLERDACRLEAVAVVGLHGAGGMSCWRLYVVVVSWWRWCRVMAVGCMMVTVMPAAKGQVGGGVVQV